MMKTMYTTPLAGALLSAMAGACQAQTLAVPFADMDTTGPIANVFTYTDTTAGGGTGTLEGRDDVEILFFGPIQPVSNSGAQTGVPYAATLFFTATITQNSADMTTNDFDSLSFTIVGSNSGPGGPLPPGTSGALNGQLILAGTAGLATTPSAGTGHAGTMVALQGDNTSTFSGSSTGAPGTTPDYVAFYSAVFYIGSPSGENYNFKFGNIKPGINYSFLTPSLYELNNFTADETATFAADLPVPEPGAVVLAIGALISFGGLRRRRRK